MYSTTLGIQTSNKKGPSLKFWRFFSTLFEPQISSFFWPQSFEVEHVVDFVEEKLSFDLSLVNVRLSQ